MLSSLFAALAAVIGLVKQMLLDVASMLLGNVTDLITALAGLMYDIHALLEKVLSLLT